MGPGIFIIAIMGCGEADAPCSTVRTLETPYESQAACTAATEDAIARNTDVDYPVVVARCIAAGAKPAVLRPGEVTLPQPERPALRTAALRRDH